MKNSRPVLLAGMLRDVLLLLTGWVAVLMAGALLRFEVIGRPVPSWAGLVLLVVGVTWGLLVLVRHKGGWQQSTVKAAQVCLSLFLAVSLLTHP